MKQVSDIRETHGIFQVFGIAIAVVGEEAQPVLTFFSSITVIMMRITQWIITLAPVGVLFLVIITSSISVYLIIEN